MDRGRYKHLFRFDGCWSVAVVTHRFTGMIDDGLASLTWAGSNVVNKKNDDITSRSFAAANFASILPEYRNKEQDIVRNAFNGGNYQSLRDMPDKFDTQTVSAARNMKAARNLKTTATPQKTSFKKMYFQYEHMADRFSLVDELNSQVFVPSISRFCC